MATHMRRKYTVCEECGEPPTEAEPFSARGLHERCALERMTKSARQLQAKKGPYYEEWRRGVVAHAQQVIDG